MILSLDSSGYLQESSSSVAYEGNIPMMSSAQCYGHAMQQVAVEKMSDDIGDSLYPVYTIQPVVKPVCQTGLTAGLTTVLNEQLFAQPVVKPRCTTGLTTDCIHDTAGCQTGCQTGFDNRLNVCIHDTTACQTG